MIVKYEQIIRHTKKEKFISLQKLEWNDNYK